jgi:hypothetical protein
VKQNVKQTQRGGGDRAESRPKNLNPRSPLIHSHFEEPSSETEKITNTAMKQVSLLLWSLLFAVSAEAKKHNDLDNRSLQDEMLCRCEAMYEDLYDDRRLQEENYYVIDGIRILPPSDPACSIGSFRHRKLKVSRVRSD